MDDKVTYREYRLYDGTVIGGSTECELVESMAGMKFTKPRSRTTYRRATAKRTKEFYNVEIDYSTDEAFIASLLEAGLLVDAVI